MRVAICRPEHGAAYRKHERCVSALKRAEPTWEELPFYCPNLNLGREAISEKALESGFDALLWIDNDMTFTPEAAQGIVGNAMDNGAIVGGLYLEKALGGAIRGDFLESRAPVRFFADDSPLVEMATIGFGFVAFPAWVLTRVAAHHELPWQTIAGTRVRSFFTPDTRAPTKTTDDYVFCHLARAAGVQIFADTRFRLGHIGEYEFTLDDMNRK